MMSSRHPLAKCPRVLPAQLEGETLIESRSSSVAPTRERMGAYSFSNVVMMVETGIGVAIVPSNLRNRLFAGLCFAELEGPWQQMEFVALCMPDNPNPCAREFFAFLSGYQKEEEPGEGAAAGAAPPAKEN